MSALRQRRWEGLKAGCGWRGWKKAGLGTGTGKGGSAAFPNAADPATGSSRSRRAVEKSPVGEASQSRQFIDTHGLL